MGRAKAENTSGGSAENTSGPHDESPHGGGRRRHPPPCGEERPQAALHHVARWYFRHLPALVFSALAPY